MLCSTMRIAPFTSSDVSRSGNLDLESSTIVPNHNNAARRDHIQSQEIQAGILKSAISFAPPGALYALMVCFTKFVRFSFSPSPVFPCTLQ